MGGLAVAVAVAVSKPMIHAVSSVESYIPLFVWRMKDEREFIPPIRSLHRSFIRPTGFATIWSIVMSIIIGPCAQTGHFYCFDEHSDTAYLGYLVDMNGINHIDLWTLDTINYHRSHIPLSEQILPGRSGSRAVLSHNQLLIFDGYEQSH
jgi:hypothetical protein